MKKLKIYLDTSVISHLFADDVPDKMADTNALWQDLMGNRYDVYISPVLIREIQDCSEPKRGRMLESLSMVEYELLEKNDEIIELAREYINRGVLAERHMDDCLHIAYAVVNNCDFIVSWNFRHLVNVKTINKVKVVNTIHQYKEISIISPTMIIEGA